MKRMQALKKLDSLPYPYQYFDVIAGTGTGAVQACMLGRLRMPVDLTIKAYANLANDVFSEKKRYGSGSFKTTKLKDSLGRIIQDATGDPDEPMLERQPTQGECKTLVFAMSKHNMRVGMPTIFRSYHVAANAGPECTIRDTLCATMAHPDLFKSFDIGDPPLNQSFVDAELGCNNPLAHVLTEAKTLYPDRYIASVTSIGTGHTRTIQIPDTSFLRHLLPIPAIVAMKAIAADSERVAEEMARRFKSTEDVYFRLNVDQGIQNIGADGWEQLAEVLGHTHAYMKLVEVSQRIDKLTQALDSRRPVVSAVQIDGEIQIATAITGMLPAIRRCPAPSPIFTGCEAMIRRVESCIGASTVERRVCVLYGLGGAGKTQIALKVVERTYNHWKEVIFIDATTKESIESTLKDIAVAKNVGDTYKMSHHSPFVTIYQEGAYSDCSISSMDPDDALALLLKAAQKQEQEPSPKEIDEAKELLQELGHFALAVAHAGSFIGRSPHISTFDYRYLLMRDKKQALEAYSKLPQAVKVDEHGHTVYTTWLMCYERLSSRARGLLWLISPPHHTGITIDIFRRAAKKIGSYEPTFPTSFLENSARQQLQTFFSDFVDSSQN
ncbi:unnamed protein product [Rhizoctonia solani]|uniref:PNPLA domain-containing protein n=1 Tax=Rhizoctonia solani TaxID=456999 RepID=A0A8H3APX4_9AGAM|nr:unnamed protein product [Rhizoctonia solani]